MNDEWVTNGGEDSIDLDLSQLSSSSDSLRMDDDSFNGDD